MSVPWTIIWYQPLMWYVPTDDPVALEQSRFDSASPACPPVLDFHAPPSHCSQVPSALTLPSGSPKSSPIGVTQVYAPQSRVLHSYFFFYYHTLCKKNTFLAVPTWGCTPELPTSATDCLFGPRKGSHSVLAYFKRGYFWSRGIVTFRGAWWYFWY